MNVRVATPGKTRVCPHCKSTILDSAARCPGCHHHLRFDPNARIDRQLEPTFSALKVEGAFRNPEGADSWEYSVVVAIRNDRGEEVARKIVNVGALAPQEGRAVTVSIDVAVPRKSKQ
jgi:hypothetical protein